MIILVEVIKIFIIFTVYLTGSTSICSNGPVFIIAQFSFRLISTISTPLIIPSSYIGIDTVIL